MSRAFDSKKAAFIAAILGAACSSPSSDSTPGVTGEDSLTAASACKPCVSDSECGGDECAQFDGDAFCAPLCGSGGTCSRGRVCADVSTVHGAREQVCTPSGNLCGTSVSSPSAHAGPPPNPGPIRGSVGPTGGSLSKLYFAVVGDTRPPVINDTAAYPSAVIDRIYSDLGALSPVPPFAVSSGDYLFSTANGTQAAPQLDLYLAARAHYTGTLFPAMGNHECTGAVVSNCGPGNHDGSTTNYKTFLAKMLAPIAQPKPYYAVEVDAIDHSWTAKLVVVAGNAWDTAQDAWMRQAMAKPTTYTFVIRHEPAAASTAPGVTPSERIMAQFPYTLAIVGHTHTYGKTGPRQVTIGNGGAPLTGGANYGYGLVTQRPDGAVQVDVIDYQTGMADLGFRFALKADGSPAP